MSSHSNAPDPESAWSIVFDDYVPEDEGRREALCALGNGYFVTRAATPEATANDIHYPGTYRAGLYNRLVSHVEGEDVDDESIVNLPNWLSLMFRIDEGDWFSIDDVEILAYRQILHLRHGLLHREIQFRVKRSYPVRESPGAADDASRASVYQYGSTPSCRVACRAVYVTRPCNYREYGSGEAGDPAPFPQLCRPA